jgi:hypothetical protein
MVGTDERMARLESELTSLRRQVRRELKLSRSVHRSLRESIDRVDTRLDKIELLLARGLGIVAVLVILASLLGPIAVDQLVGK